MSEIAFNGIAFAGGSAPAPVAPTVNIGAPSPTSGVAGTLVCNWAVTYTGTVTAYNFILAEIATTGTTASGTWSVINGTTATPTVRFTSTAGIGGIAKFKVLAGAVQNGATNNVESAFATLTTSTATPPTVNIGAPTPTYIDVGQAATFAVTYSGTVTAYNLIPSECSKLFISGTPAGTFTVQNGTTATPTITWTSSAGVGTIQVKVLAGACQNTGVNNTASAYSSNLGISEPK